MYIFVKHIYTRTSEMKINENTFQHIYDLYFYGMSKFLTHYISNTALIEDIIQEVFITLWTERETMDIKHIKTYLYTSARNRALNHLRDEKRRSELLSQWSENELIIRKERQEEEDPYGFLLRKAIDNLPDRCREIYLLSREDHFTYQEIASTLFISVKTVEAQMGIALKKIRSYLHEKTKNSTRN